MLPRRRRQSHHTLLQERERAVDVHGLSLGGGVQRPMPRGPLLARHGLLQALAARQIHQVQLGEQRLLAAAQPGALLDVHCEHTVRPVALLVQQVLRRRARDLASEQLVQRLLLRRHRHLRQTLHHRAAQTAGVVRDGKLATLHAARSSLQLLEQIEDALIVDLQVCHVDLEVHVRPRFHLRKQLRQRTRRHASVLEAGSAPDHGERFSRSSLTVGHDGRVDPVQHRGHCLAAKCLVCCFL
mmetsp:Transcript_22896/g.73726  ORF Transcript_22896/g.73726 Transcript_22896/m.73726 type:complete len:241 (-) Transcript_22896:178-900(-)